MSRLLIFTLSITIPGIIFGYTAGPPDGIANNPPSYNNCTYCHNTYAVNSGNGSFSMVGLPEFYEPGQSYTFSIELEDIDQRKWGFEISAQLENFANGGELIIIDPDHTQFSTQSNIDYVKQTSSGAYSGTLNASPGWDVSWTAPVTGMGTVTFYGSGNAANRNSSTSGDYIYTLEIAVPEYAAPPEPVEYLVISASGNDVILSWPAATGAAEYNIYRSSDPYFEAGGTPYQTVSGTSYIDIGMVSAGTYHYIVTASN